MAATTAPDEVIVVKGLTKHYGDVEALNGADITVRQGDFFGLLGPNGAGKTTLLKILTGQLRATTGEATVLGLDVQSEPLEVKRRIGIVPEQESPPSFLTIRETLELVAEVRELENPDIDHWFEFLELKELEGRLCRNLSRGQRQKVMLAAAFLARPPLLFLDEPLINLDPMMQSRLRQWLSDYVTDGGTVFMNTHLLDHAEKLCDHAAIIHRGEVRATITLADLRRQELGLEDLFREMVQ